MADSRAVRAVAADPGPDQPAERPDPDDLVYAVVENGSITAEWDTGPWRGKSTSRFTGGFDHHSY